MKKDREIFGFRFAGRGVHALGSIGASVIGSVASSAIGGIMQGNASGDAADAQIGMSKEAIAAMQAQQAKTDAALQPYVTSGNEARMALDRLLGTVGYNPDAAIAGPSGESMFGVGTLLKPYTGESLKTDPGYAFGLQQGELGINRALAARGSFDSGAALKELLRYNSDYAGTKFNEGFNRDQAQKQQIYQMLSGPSQAGLQAIGTQAQTGAQTSSALSGLYTGIGNAQAAGIVGQGNAYGNILPNAYNSYTSNQQLNRLLNGGGGGTMNYGDTVSSGQIFSGDPLQGLMRNTYSWSG